MAGARTAPGLLEKHPVQSEQAACKYIIFHRAWPTLEGSHPCPPSRTQRQGGRGGGAGCLGCLLTAVAWFAG